MSPQKIGQAVLDFDAAKTVALVQSSLDSGVGALDILNNGLIAAMDEVGKRFSEGTCFLPEMLMAANTMKAGLDVLKPHLGESGLEQHGTIVLGTVKDDMHDIGKNLVGIMMESAGFKVVDLGVNVDGERFVSEAKINQADLIGLSALLTTTMDNLEEIVGIIKKDSQNIPVIVGGAPVTQEFADQINADAYAKDAGEAVIVSRRVIACH